VRPRKNGEVIAYLLPLREKKKIDLGSTGDNFRFQELDPNSRREKLISILRNAGVELTQGLPFTADGKRPPFGTALIALAQPYGSFAKALLETRTYPNLEDSSGNPISPYDVTAHTLPLLMDVEVIPVRELLVVEKPKRGGSGLGSGSGSGYGCGCSHGPRFAIYQSSPPSMDEGWTRWITTGTSEYQICCGEFDSIRDEELRSTIEHRWYKTTATIIFPDQSPNQMLNGYAKGSMPDEYTGGVGKEGVENLKKFVEAGGTLVFLNRASNFAIREFNLPVRDVTAGLARKDFFIPGSILRTELDLTHPIAKGMPKESIAWFENSPAFDVGTTGITSSDSPGAPSNRRFSTAGQITADGTKSVRIIARYPSEPKNVLLSGWALGADKIAGKAALVEVTMGKGKIVLFGFRPQYRGQSLATFPLLFNAISN